MMGNRFNLPCGAPLQGSMVWAIQYGGHDGRILRPIVGALRDHRLDWTIGADMSPTHKTALPGVIGGRGSTYECP